MVCTLDDLGYNPNPEPAEGTVGHLINQLLAARSLKEQLELFLELSNFSGITIKAKVGFLTATGRRISWFDGYMPLVQVLCRLGCIDDSTDEERKELIQAWQTLANMTSIGISVFDFH